MLIQLNLLYNFVEAGFELTEAVTEAALALGLKAVELMDSELTTLFDMNLGNLADWSHSLEEVDLVGNDYNVEWPSESLEA